jgi:hypothetical protein
MPDDPRSGDGGPLMRARVGILIGLLASCAGGVAAAQDLSSAAPALDSGVAGPVRLDDPRFLFAVEPAPESASAFSQNTLPQTSLKSSSPRHEDVKSLFKHLWGDIKALPSKENLYWAAAGGGLALAVHPIDDNVMNAWAYNNTLQNVFKLGKYLGQSYVLIPIALTVYVVGRAKDEPKVSHVGMDLTESLLISEMLVQTLKYTVRRERPDGSGKNSFPSGHSADTFAFATALERHLGWKGAVPAYIFSSYVAISRIPDNRHWLSDTVFGAAVGIISGRTVTRHGKPYPFTVAMVRGGAEIMYVRTASAK